MNYAARGLRCVYCHDDAPTVHCGCGAAYHEDCSLGPCATIGCLVRREPTLSFEVFAEFKDASARWRLSGFDPCYLHGCLALDAPRHAQDCPNNPAPLGWWRRLTEWNRRRKARLAATAKLRRDNPLVFLPPLLDPPRPSMASRLLKVLNYGQ